MQIYQESPSINYNNEIHFIEKKKVDIQKIFGQC